MKIQIVLKTQIILWKLKLFYENSNYFTKTKIILRKLKLFYVNSNYFTKTQIIVVFFSSRNCGKEVLSESNPIPNEITFLLPFPFVC